MNEQKTLEEFSLLGGPLQRLACRLHLVRGGTDTIPLGLALGGFLWIVLVALTLIDGVAPRLFSLSYVGVHARLLIAIPLFFVCESWLDPRITAFVRAIVSSRVVPDAALPTLLRDVARTVRWKDSWLPEVVCAMAAVALSLIAWQLNPFGATATYDPNHNDGVMFLSGRWYWTVCLTIFRFLMFRWFWRLGLWCHFLWRISRLKLHLVPTHPDGVAGLGSLEVVHSQFAPLVLAISVVMSASFAEEISAGSMQLEGIFPTLALILVADAIVFLGPLYMLTPQLRASRIKGLGDYMALATCYVNDFEKKWLPAANARTEDLLGTADLQSLADLNSSVSVVKDMRLVPISMRLAMGLAAPALLPMLPLLLLKYPIADLTQKFFQRLSGM